MSTLTDTIVKAKSVFDNVGQDYTVVNILHSYDKEEKVLTLSLDSASISSTKECDMVLSSVVWSVDGTSSIKGTSAFDTVTLEVPIAREDYRFVTTELTSGLLLEIDVQISFKGSGNTIYGSRGVFINNYLLDYKGE